MTATLILVIVSALTAQTPLPTYDCYYTTDRIVIDGILNERTWQRAIAVPLALWDGSGMPKRRTIARLAWDDKNLYIAYEVEDDDIQCTMRTRDAHLWTEEVVEFFIDPGNDLTSYFELEWNALGACVDLLILDVQRRRVAGELAWDARGMKWKVKRTNVMRGKRMRGWVLEVALPLQLMIDAPNIPPKDGDRWRMNLYRIERSDGRVEYSCWSPVLGEKPNYHRPRRFGYLVFRKRH